MRGVGTMGKVGRVWLRGGGVGTRMKMGLREVLGREGRGRHRRGGGTAKYSTDGKALLVDVDGSEKTLLITPTKKDIDKDIFQKSVSLWIEEASRKVSDSKSSEQRVELDVKKNLDTFPSDSNGIIIKGNLQQKALLYVTPGKGIKIQNIQCILQKNSDPAPIPSPIPASPSTTVIKVYYDTEVVGTVKVNFNDNISKIMEKIKDIYNTQTHTDNPDAFRIVEHDEKGIHKDITYPIRKNIQNRTLADYGLSAQHSITAYHDDSDEEKDFDAGAPVAAAPVVTQHVPDTLNNSQRPQH